MAEFRRRRAKLRVKAEEIDYKNVDLLKRFVSDKGRINPSSGIILIILPEVRI